MSLPYYKMFAKDFEASESVRTMSWAERGLYGALLNLSWVNDGLPLEPERIARLCGASADEFAAMWPVVSACFPVLGDRRRNPRQEREREEALTKSEKASRSAGKRWSKDANAMPTHMLTHCEGNARASGSVSGSDSESEKQEKTSLPENQPAPLQTVDQRPGESVSRAFEQPAGDPFEAAGFSGEFEVRLWFEDLVKRHPNKTRNRLAHGKLREEILCGRFSRAEFEAWHAQSMHNPRWHEAGGHYAPNLYSILDDCLWKHAPPDFTDPQVFLKPKGRSVMDDV